MSGKEFCAMSAALCFGFLAGFGAMRWRHSSAPAETARAAKADERSIPSGEMRPKISVEPLDAILKEPIESRRLVALDRYCESLDAEAVRRAVESLPRNLGRRELEVLGRLLGRWAELEPAAAADFILARNADSSFYPFHPILRNIAELWLLKDAEAAKRYVLNLQGEQLGRFISSFANALARQDPEQALAFAEQVPAAEKGQLLTAGFSELAAKDAAAAAVRALMIPSVEWRQKALDGVCRPWLRSDPTSAMDWIMRQPDTAGERGAGISSQENWLQDWANFDPEGAGKYAARISDEAKRDVWSSRTAMLWAVLGDPGEAFAYWQQLPDTDQKMSALSMVLEALPDRREAMEYATRLPAGPKRDMALRTLGEKWAAQDPESALAWLTAISDDALYEVVAPGAIGALAHTDFARATSEFEKLTSPKVRERTASILANWRERDDPFGAAGWLLSLSPADANAELVQRFVSNLTSDDSAATAAWLETLTDSPRRDEAVAGFAQVLKGSEPVQAARWAMTVADPKTRDALLTTIVASMAKFDAAGAREWVRQQNFDAAQTKSLLEKIQPEPPKK